ncbi:unnamed protein product [Prunus armeniaca]
MDDSKAEVQDTLLEINLGTRDNHWPIYINGRMVPKLRAKMEELLKEFKDCFAFVYTEMLGLSRDLVEHDLPTVEDFKPFKQPPRRMSAEVELHDSWCTKGELKLTKIRLGLSLMRPLWKCIANSIGKAGSFLSLLKLKEEEKFRWEEVHQKAFNFIKEYLAKPSVLIMLNGVRMSMIKD